MSSTRTADFRLLVVDDNEAIHSDLKKILLPPSTDSAMAADESVLFGTAPTIGVTFAIDSAFQGADGLACVQRALADGAPYALAFIDVRMPPGWDGIETICHLWETDPYLQIVICTAYSDYNWQDIEQRLGVSDNFVILKKPFDIIEVRQLAHALTAKWTSTRRARLRMQELDSLVEQRTAELLRTNRKLAAESAERQRVYEELVGYREHLEDLVRLRTAALESKEEQFRLLLESTAEAISGMDQSGRCTFCNPAWLRMFGYKSAEEVIGRDLHELVHHHTYDAKPIPAEECGLRKVAILGKGVHADNEVFWRADGTYFPAEYWSHPQVVGGRIVGAVNAIIDITERKLGEAELLCAKDAAEAANRAKSMFLANMSHEIRTPMNGILGFSQLLLRGAGLSDQQRSQLHTINRCGEHLMSLLNDILEMSKIEAGRTTLNVGAFDLRGLIDDLEAIFRMRADEKKLEFIVERIGDIPPSVTGDESKLRQVLINLLGNALKFTTQGGVVLRVRVQDDVSSGLRLEAEVQDTGVGISEDEIGSVFEYFEQTQSGRKSGTGTGLGLAISRAFARLMSGDITVQSHPGQGSVFRFSVPLQLAKDSVCKGPSLRRVDRLKTNQPKFRVLIADDKEENRLLLTQLLEPIGFELHEAANGVEAVRSYEQWHPHLILMDVIMPLMDGNEAVREIRERFHDRSVKIITISASTFEQDKKLALGTGADDFIGKPFRQPELLEKIRVQLGAEYIYKDEFADSPQDGTAADVSLAVVPKDLLAKISAAARVGEFDQVMRLIAEVALLSPQAAAKLGRLAEDFDSDKLLRLIQ
jgi:two-component system sensor histidine kinase/response regulator